MSGRDKSLGWALISRRLSPLAKTMEKPQGLESEPCATLAEAPKVSGVSRGFYSADSQMGISERTPAKNGERARVCHPGPLFMSPRAAWNLALANWKAMR